MRIVITGANSALGQAILRCRSEPGAPPNELVAAVRSERAADEIRPLLGEGSARSKFPTTIPAAWTRRFEGLLPSSTWREFWSSGRVRRMNRRMLRRPAASWKPRSGARGEVRFVSATGADETSSNGYYRSKGQAEALVRASGLCYTILRAPLLLGGATEGAAALKRNASRRKAKLIGGGRNFQQPLHVDDLARAAIAATQPSVASNRTLDLVGPVSLPERELVERAARALGHQVRVSSISKGIAFVCAGHSSARIRPRIFAGRGRRDYGRHASGSATCRE
jgi:hypothetical protein